MKAIIYTRVSTVGQAQDGLSLEAQESKLRAWADLNEAESVATFTDAGISGKKASNRPGLQAALSAIGKGDALVVYSLSRLARSTKDAISISEMLAKKDANLVSLSEKIDTTTAAGKMVFRMLAVLSEFERDLVSERTCAVLAHKRAQGEKTGGCVPYGFRLENGRLVKDENEQKAVALIRELRGAGHSLRAIAAELEARGYRTKAGLIHWQPAAIADVLRRMDRDEKEKAA